MSGSDKTDSGKSDSGSARWAALDSRYERLVMATDRVLGDSDGKDRDSELRAAS